MRIVSLLPSATEIVCALGLGDQLVGVTHECDHPQSVQSLPRVTRTVIPADAASCEIDRLVSEQLKTTKALYQLDLPLLKELRPDVIVTQSLCDVCAVSPNEVQAALAQLPGTPRVVNLEPQSLDGLFEAIRQVASAIGVSAESWRLLAVVVNESEIPLVRGVVAGDISCHHLSPVPCPGASDDIFADFRTFALGRFGSALLFGHVL